MNRKTFISSKYNTLLRATVFTAMLSYLPHMIDSFVAGNIIGEQALAVINIVSPILMLPFMVYLLLVPGIIMKYSVEIGKTNVKKADQFFSLSVELAVFSGILLAVTAFVIREPYLNYMGISGEMLDMARKYYTCIIGYVSVQPLCFFSNEMLIEEGMERTSAFGAVFQTAANAVLSFVLAGFMGITGVGLATFISSLMIPVIMYFVYFKKAIAEKFHFYFNLNEIKEAGKYGFVDFSVTLIYAGAEYWVSKFILGKFGDDQLVVWAVVLIIYDMFALLSGFSDALKPFQRIYKGETNEVGIKSLMKHASFCAFIGSAFLSLLVFLISPYICASFGVTSRTLLAGCIRACRYMCFVTFSYSVIELLSVYYIDRDKYILSTAGSGILYLASFLAGPFIMSNLIGSEGIFVGFALGIFVSPVLYSALIILKTGKAGFPLYLSDKAYSDYMTSFLLSEKEIGTAVLQIRDLLNKKSIDPSTVNKIQLFVEELSMHTLSHNHGKKVYAEISLLFRENIRLIMKDTGEFDDLTDEDKKIEDLRMYILSTVMSAQREKIYLITGGYNRSVYDFPYVNKNEGDQ